jgi:hypothetical protein
MSISLTDVITLLNGGYTKDEIAAMANTDQVDTTPDQTEPAPDQTEPEEDENENPASDQTTDAPTSLVDDQNLKAIEELKKQIAEQTKDINSLKNQLINKNINTKTQPETGKPNVYDFLADSIR